MKNFLAITALSLTVSCMHSKTGSGKIITEKRSIAAFTAVHASGGLHLQIKQGAQPSVTVEADDNIMPFVETKVSGNTLDVRLRNLNSLTNATINVYVTAPKLRELNASGGAEIISKDTVSSWDNLALKADGGARIDAVADAPAVTIDAGSGSQVNASGRTKDLTIDAGAGAEVNAGNLKAENAKASSGSGASVKVFGSVSVNAEAESGGSIIYTGGAANVIKKAESGGSVSGS